ncbi:hypothetical protein [Beijerinckia mobilis]|nr:hypothetical protein [Beijerinckia mobilis]
MALRTGANTSNLERLRVTLRQIYVFAQATQRDIPHAHEAIPHG